MLKFLKLDLFDCQGFHSSYEASSDHAKYLKIITKVEERCVVGWMERMDRMKHERKVESNHWAAKPLQV